MIRPDRFLVTCEHAGNRIPSLYRDFFRGREFLLRTHRGYDAGALRLARELSAALCAPLMISVVSRLLVDLNRSLRHRHLFSEATRPLPLELRQEILDRYYLPYRAKAEALIAQEIESGARIIHVSCHSFTPVANGEERNADLGLLYDSSRPAEAELCRHWRAALKARAGALKTRMNYPYLGTADGFTVYLRRRFPSASYVGIELEVNQKHVHADASHWCTIRNAIIQSLLDAKSSLHFSMHVIER